MSDATNPQHRELLAERFGEDLVPLDQEPGPSPHQLRLKSIEAVRYVLATVTAMVGLPAIASCTFLIWVDDLAQLTQLAEQYGREIYGTEGRRLFSVDLPVEGLISATVTVAVRPPERPL